VVGVGVGDGGGCGERGGVADGEGEVGGDGLVGAEGAEAGCLCQSLCLSFSFSLSLRRDLPSNVKVAWVKGHVQPVGAIWESSQPLAVCYLGSWFMVQPTCVDGYVHCWALV
jgi:hypothetical protein